MKTLIPGHFNTWLDYSSSNADAGKYSGRFRQPKCRADFIELFKIAFRLIPNGKKQNSFNEKAEDLFKLMALYFSVEEFSRVLKVIKGAVDMKDFLDNI